MLGLVNLGYHWGDDTNIEHPTSEASQLFTVSGHARCSDLVISNTETATLGYANPSKDSDGPGDSGSSRNWEDEFGNSNDSGGGGFDPFDDSDDTSIESFEGPWEYDIDRDGYVYQKAAESSRKASSDNAVQVFVEEIEDVDLSIALKA